MSKTERDLSSDGGVGALGDLFTDADFDSAFDDAIEHADLELDINDFEVLDGDVDVDETALADSDSDDALVEGNEVLDDELVTADLVDDESVDTESVDTESVDTESVDTELVDDDPGTDDQVDAELVDDATVAIGDVAIGDVAVDSETAADDLADGEFVMPEIVSATPDAEPDARTPVGDPELDRDDDDPLDDDVSDEILEELRRADIDGPVVAHAPQDDTTAAVRRPRRSADYDPAPVPIPAKVPRVLGRKPRVRKVTRVVRHVDPWSVFKIAIVAHFLMYVILLTASVLLWNVAYATGTVDNVERFFESFGWNSFEFNGGELYHAGWISGLFVVIGFTGLAVLAATLFNLITDLVGGVRFTVLEEEVIETRTSPMRRFVVRRSEPEVPALLHDASGSMFREAVVDDSGANQRPTR